VSFQDIITSDIRERLSRPTGDGGTCLPNACYTDAEWLKLENERLFARTWMYAGCLDQLAQPGDAFPTTIGGKPVLLVHGRDGEIRAFHNVCRHRGAVLVDKPCKGLAALTCPYHAWAYGLDGSLRTRLHFDGAGKHDLSGQGPGLVPIPMAMWFRAIFINLDGKAEPFEDYIAPLGARLPHHDLGALRLHKTVEWEFRANWKLVFENYFDNYHIGTIHPKLDAFAPMVDRRGFEPLGKFLHTELYFDAPEDGRGVGLPYYPNLPPGEDRFEAGYHLFPSCCYQVWLDQLTIFQVFPIAPDHTVEHLHVFLIGEAATDPAYGEAAQGVCDMWDELNREDVDAIEWMQKGRQSPAFDGGMLSGWWDQSHQHFARLVVEAMS
jgi:choline monooxygenase